MGFVKHKLKSTRHFFSTEIWQTRLDTLPSGQARRYRAARVLYRTAQTLVLDDVLHVRSAALTYFTVLSIVPLLAFVFAILKGFGAYDALIDQTVRPYLLDTFQGNPALQNAFEQILVFVTETGVTSLGFLGLVTLLYTATRLLRNIEISMNEIWQVESARSLFRQITEYAAILMITPMCLLLAAGLGTATQLVDLVRGVAQWVGVEGVLDWMLGVLGPLLVIMLGFFALYQIMPNCRVGFRSAALGALVGGLLWYAGLIAHVRFQVGVAKFNALYSGFAAIPIFLVWAYVSWLTVLVGAQVAASFQQVDVMAQRKRATPLSQHLKEAVALAVVLRIAASFVRGEAHLAMHQLRAVVDVDGRLLERVLESLEEARLIVRAHGDDDAEAAFVLGRPTEQIRVKDVLDAMRGEVPAPRQPSPVEDSVALEVLQALDEEQASSSRNRSVAELLRERGAERPSEQRPAPGLA